MPRDNDMTDVAIDTVIDFSGVPDYEPIAPGTYEATFTGHKFRKARDGASNICAMEFTITEDDPDVHGRKVFRNQSMKPESLWALKRAMLALGTDADAFDGRLNVDEELGEAHGSQVRIRVTREMVEGTIRNNIADILAE